MTTVDMLAAITVLFTEFVHENDDGLRDDIADAFAALVPLGLIDTLSADDDSRTLMRGMIADAALRALERGGSAVEVMAVH